MATYFVVSDVHGFYNELLIALDKVDFDIDNPDHVFVSVGDLLDRGPDAVKCLQFVNSIPASRKILIRGNHEDLMEEAIKRGYFLSHDRHNRTDNTVEQLVSNLYPPTFYDGEMLKRMETYEDWIKYITSCIDYYETDKYVFVHSFIPITDGDWRNGNWEDARWGNPFELWKNGKNITGKTIVCGHWHTSWAHAYLHNKGTEFNDTPFNGLNTANFGIFEDDGIIGLDACVAYSGHINILKLTNQYAIDNQPIDGQISIEEWMSCNE